MEIMQILLRDLGPDVDIDVDRLHVFIILQSVETKKHGWPNVWTYYHMI